MDGIEVRGVESEGQLGAGGGKGGVTVKVQVGSHDCWVGYRAATRLSRYYYRYRRIGAVLEGVETVGRRWMA